MITAYFRQLWYRYAMPYKVYPIEKSPDGTYEKPEQLPKGKREFAASDEFPLGRLFLTVAGFLGMLCNG